MALLQRALAAAIFAFVGIAMAHAPVTPSLASAASEQSFNAPAAQQSAASYNWAGYVSDKGQYSAVSASWQVPTVSARESLAADATWVGIGGVGADDLIQVGTQALTKDGEVQYEGWYEALPDSSQRLPIAVHPGDSISAALTEISPGEWRITFINNTTGKSYEHDMAYDSSRSSAEWIEESPMLVWGGSGSSIIPLTDFGQIVFRNASAVKDGEATTPQGANAVPLSLRSRRGVPMAEPSELGDDGASFSVTRVSAPLPRS